jgi:hypothetical protein
VGTRPKSIHWNTLIKGKFTRAIIYGVDFFDSLSRKPLKGKSATIRLSPNDAFYSSCGGDKSFNRYLQSLQELSERVFALYDGKSSRNKKEDEFNIKPSQFITGRLILNLWLVFKEEFKLKNYKLGNISRHILGKNLVELSQESLSEFFESGGIHLINDYFYQRIDICEALLVYTDYINMATEFSRLYGISMRSIDRG